MCPPPVGFTCLLYTSVSALSGHGLDSLLFTLAKMVSELRKEEPEVTDQPTQILRPPSVGGAAFTVTVHTTGQEPIYHVRGRCV